MDTKDRIRQIMESQHMTQQVFADFLQQSPATLSSIFNGRTHPSFNIYINEKLVTIKELDSIKEKIPDISIEWLLYGTGDMYISHSDSSADTFSPSQENGQDMMLQFETSSPASQGAHPISPNSRQNPTPSNVFQQGVRNTPSDYVREEIRLVEKEPRHVTEIRVYYDDQTYETFVPAKK